MDFGIAKILDRDEKMTVTGALVGSPAHMAPEMIEGLEAGREADIFSLGTIFYWLCCGRLPFVGKSTTQTLKLILEARYPDPRLTAPAVSDEISSVLATCLAKDPEARFPSAGVLQKTLADILRSQGIANIDHELSSFFSNPTRYSKSLEQNLISRWMRQAEHFLQGPKRNIPQGLDRLNRVLSLCPCHSEASRLISTVRTRRRKQRWLVAAATSIGCIVLLLLIWGIWETKTSLPGFLAFQSQPASVLKSTQATNSLKKEPPFHKSKQVVIPSVTEPATTNISAYVSKKTKTTNATSFLSNASISRATLMRKIAIKVRPQQYARIYLDQKLMNPHSPTFEGQIPVGKHQLKIESDYSWPIEQEIDILSATENAPLQQFVIDLEQKPALLVIKSSLKEMRFLINGMPSSGNSGDSETDPVPVPLPEGHLRGKAKIRAFCSGYRDYELTADFTAGKVRELSIELEKQ
jgi:serine/threonine-protein kinase